MGCVPSRLFRTQPPTTAAPGDSDQPHRNAAHSFESLAVPQDSDLQRSQLMGLLKALQADGYPSAWQKRATLTAHLDAIIASTESYRELLEYTGDEAQLIIEAIQWLLNFHPSLEEGIEKRCPYIQALVRLAGKVGLVPRSYRLDKFEGKVLLFQSPVVDIYKAGHPGRSVCLKQYRINPKVNVDNAKRLSIREAIFWFNHQHPNVLPFLGVVETRSAFYLVSPYFEFGTLADYLKTSPTLDRRLLVQDITSGLDYFHSYKFIHADIKPQNIFMHTSGRAVLADLGLSRLSDSDILTWPSVQTIDPQLAPGIYPWLAPEILSAGILEPNESGRLVVFTSASDVYALGGVIYEIFTGLMPFHDFGLNEIIQRVPQGARP